MRTDDLAAKWGRLAENAIRHEYQKTGWFVVPTYAIQTGGAPMLIGLIERFVLPDLQVFKPGHAPRWVEVKYKHHADRFQIRQQWQHGIDLPNWYAYLQVQEKTGFGGRLAIVQAKPGRQADPNPVHLWQELDELAKYVQIREEPHTTFRRGSAYFPIDAFRCSPIDFALPIDLPPLPHKINPWEQKSRAGVAPQWPIEYCDQSPFERGSDALPLFGRTA